jgi:cysteine desulfurase
MPNLPIYMDNHATTRVDPRVVEAMLPFFTERYGNAASTNHVFGWEADEACSLAREQIAALVGATAKEIVFTSGATESNNLALKGAARMYRRKGKHLVTAAAEHKAVLDPCKRLGREGWDVTILPVDRTGRVDSGAVRDALRDDTVLVSVMLANNEVGTINPLGEIGRLCKERGVLLHSDATQAVGKVPVDVEELGVDLLSCSAHKLYGPKGVGALYVRRRNPQVRIEPILDGGGHERGMRSGTLPVPNIVGFGKACELCAELMQADGERIGALRDALYRGIVDRVEQVTLNGHPTDRLAGNLNLSFAFVEGEALMMSMKDVAVSSGSACTSANPEPSHVLLAMGIGEELTRASIRFGLGRFNTEDEVDFTVEAVADAVARLRSMSSVK